MLSCSTVHRIYECVCAVLYIVSRESRQCPHNRHTHDTSKASPFELNHPCHTHRRPSLARSCLHSDPRHATCEEREESDDRVRRSHNVAHTSHRHVTGWGACLQWGAPSNPSPLTRHTVPALSPLRTHSPDHTQYHSTPPPPNLNARHDPVTELRAQNTTNWEGCALARSGGERAPPPSASGRASGAPPGEID